MYNLYFIIVHLFSLLVSHVMQYDIMWHHVMCLQIFLNFFSAVILDNLEYDEEEKKIKLEVGVVDINLFD